MDNYRQEEKTNLEELTEEQMDKVAGGQKHYHVDCPYCGKSFVQTKLTNHMTHCPKRPQEQK